MLCLDIALHYVKTVQVEPVYEQNYASPQLDMARSRREKAESGSTIQYQLSYFHLELIIH